MNQHRHFYRKIYMLLKLHEIDNIKEIYNIAFQNPDERIYKRMLVTFVGYHIYEHRITQGNNNTKTLEFILRAMHPFHFHCVKNKLYF